MAMVVHIVRTPRDGKRAAGKTPPVGLCGEKVDGFYVRATPARPPLRRLCAKCLAAQGAAARPAEVKPPAPDR
jgi:hypothetical protein